MIHKTYLWACEISNALWRDDKVNQFDPILDQFYLIEEIMEL